MPMPTHMTVAMLTIVSLLLSPAGPGRGWQPLHAAAVQPAPQGKPAARAQPSDRYDIGWPRAYSTPSGARLVFYQPQIADWPGQKHMTAYAAVSYLARNAQKPAIGTIRIETDASVAVAERLVSFRDFRITEANFPTLAKEQLRDVLSEFAASVPHEDRVIGLDRVLAMVNTSQVTPRNIEGVKADPPMVFYSEKPAVLVIFDGEPIWSPIEGNDLRFAVNTNWDVFEHSPSGNYYLRLNDGWMASPAIRGPWSRTGRLPDSFGRLPDDGNWTEVKAAAKNTSKTAPPAVFVSTVPGELILLNGAPQYAAIANTNLLWVSNTESDVFRLRQDGPIFYLVSGRWFSAPQFKGPWTFATPTLPDDFKKIPLEHVRSRVLASVPGTRQAIEAVVVAQVPQTATVSRKAIEAPTVVYQGKPTFQPIEKTTIARAVNTDRDILKVGDLYYLCFEGVWFRSTSPTGPWQVTDSVPGQIYEIPISSPAHNVTYVTVEDSNDDSITFVAAAAYTGMMVAWGCAVWGNGWYYPPYYYPGHYPVYFPHYPTYGYGAWYNPWTGAYGRGGAIYGPYGGAGYGARYNPSTGRYSRGAVAYGPYGARGAAEAWNPRTGAYGQTRQGANVYGSWGATSVQRGDQWASTARVTSRATGTTTRVTEGSGGGAAITRRGPDGGGGIARTGSGDIYAGHDGNAYRNQGGGWQKYDNGAWTNVERPQRPEGTAGTVGAEARKRAGQTGLSSPTMDQLNRDRAARVDGSQRMRDLGSMRGTAPRSAGSYRPGAGGGGRRR